MIRGDRRMLVAASVLATAALVLGISSTDLWPPDETRVAEVARETPGADGWLVPELNGAPFLEEPPLFYWLQAGVYRLAGMPSASGARLPAAAAAICGVSVTALLARAAGASAPLAALVLASAPEWWWMARSGTPDTANAAAAALALLAFFHAWRSGRGGMLAVAAAAAAFWLKSLLGVGLLLLTAGAFMALAGRGQLAFRRIGWGLIALGASVGVWLVAVGMARGEGAVAFFLVENHLERLLGGPAEGHVRPIWYYLVNLPLDLLPWSIVLPAAMTAAWRKRADPARLFVLVWAGVMTLALSLAATKRAHYLLAAYPAFAVLVALWWVGPPGGRLHRATRALLAAALLVVYPLVTLALGSADAAALATVASSRHRVWALASVIRLGHGAFAWTAGLVLMLGAVFVVAQRAGRPLAAAAAAGVSATVVHLLLTLTILPRLNGFVSARPVAEALGRAADDGVALVAFGFQNREQLSPFLFYGRHRVVEAQTPDDLEAHLIGARACALMPAAAYLATGDRLRAHAVTRRSVGQRSFVLLSGSAGGCPAEERAQRPCRKLREADAERLASYLAL